jgi:D,D-heptose 1,7-bisphosphate phosphatase
MEINHKKAVILDRDGTVIVEKEFISNPADVELVEGAAESIKLLHDSGFAVVIISNQSGVARGYFDENDVRAINDQMTQLLNRHGATIDGIYWCPHYIDGLVAKYAVDCDCRKPKTGLVSRAVKELNIEPAYVIGDRKSDIDLGTALDVPAILVQTGYGLMQSRETIENSAFFAKNILEAVLWIVERGKI